MRLYKQHNHDLNKQGFIELIEKYLEHDHNCTLGQKSILRYCYKNKNVLQFIDTDILMSALDCVSGCLKQAFASLARELNDEINIKVTFCEMKDILAHKILNGHLDFMQYHDFLTMFEDNVISTSDYERLKEICHALDIDYLYVLENIKETLDSMEMEDYSNED